MPIKLKKTDILNNLDNPSEGYVILGFDETGTLVSKDSGGRYGSIVPSIATGTFDNLETTYLTLGNRASADVNTYGINSISMGNINTVGHTSFAQGQSVSINGTNSHGQGSHLTIFGDNSFIGGLGWEGQPTVVSGKTSFSFFETNDISGLSKGIFSNNSAILGGTNHRIGTGSFKSIILGGNGNIIGNSSQDSAIIGGSINTVNGNNIVILVGNNITNADNPNSVYVPKLILSSTTDTTAPNGTIRWNGSTNNFQGRKNNTWVNLDNEINDLSINTIKVDNGSAATPSYSFNNDTDSGIYSGGSGEIGFSSNGSTKFLFTADEGIQAISGSQTYPSWSFMGDPNTGMYYSAGLRFSVDGINRLTLSNTQVTSTLPFIGPVGIQGTPTYTFTGDTGTGMYRATSNVLGFSTNGVLRMSLSNTVLSTSNRIISDVGFSNPFTSLGIPTGSVFTWNVNTNQSCSLATSLNSFTISITNLNNGYMGTLIMDLTGSGPINITINPVSPFTAYISGNLTGLTPGRYVLTWVSTSTPVVSIYLNIAKYNQL